MDESRRKRVIFIGRSAAGKTTLCQRIEHEDLVYHKTQTVHIINDTLIDTPGEYLERRHFRGALMVTAADADLVVLVQDGTEEGTMFPPAYASTFAKPAVGVVTKSDIAAAEQVETAKKYLRMAGADRVFVTSGASGEGMAELIAFLDTEKGEDTPCGKRSRAWASTSAPPPRS